MSTVLEDGEAGLWDGEAVVFLLPPPAYSHVVLMQLAMVQPINLLGPDSSSMGAQPYVSRSLGSFIIGLIAECQARVCCNLISSRHCIHRQQL